MLFHIISTYLLRSGRFCSCQKPTTCPNSCMITAVSEQPRPSETYWRPPFLPTSALQLKFSWTYFNKQKSHSCKVTNITYYCHKLILKYMKLVQICRRFGVFLWKVICERIMAHEWHIHYHRLCNKSMFLFFKTKHLGNFHELTQFRVWKQHNLDL